MGWRVQAIRGATTATANTVEAIREAVWELLDELELRNEIETDWIISATFSVTPDLDAIFPAKIARERPDWGLVPLLDVQQMQVKGSLDHCIRLLIHVNLPEHHTNIHHSYLRGAKDLRPDLSQEDYSATGSNQNLPPRKSIPELIN